MPVGADSTYMLDGGEVLIDIVEGTSLPEVEAQMDTCICPTSRVERFPQACVLLFLAREPSHGYDLFQDLKAFGLGDDLPDPATLYKNLRRMEARGLVISEWQHGEAGPGRRGYQLTPKGWHYLDGWVDALTQGRVLIDRFLTEKSQLSTADRSPDALVVSKEASGRREDS